MASLADKAILSGADNRPPMLEKDMYDSWKRRMELYMLNRPHGRMILESVEQGPLIWPTVEVEGVTILKKYPELSAAEAIQADCDEKKAKLFNEWERFTSNQGESIESYYHRFLKLMNDLKRNKHFPEKIVSNLKFLNNLQPEWSRHRISSNPRKRQIAQLGMNMGQDRQMQMVGGYSDADYAGCKDTFKSTSGRAKFLGEKLVSWSSKKQDCTALSTAEAKYVSLSACSIAISCNLVQHSRTKHIAFRFHFIKDHMEKGTIELYFVKTDYQLADIFTKDLPTDHFNYLVCRLGMRSLSPKELERLAKSL
nr:retrovirus-related Pol polyprotein from transposon TNT 1-94 [Tanacetum cinerariifolium]